MILSGTKYKSISSQTGIMSIEFDYLVNKTGSNYLVDISLRNVSDDPCFYFLDQDKRIINPESKFLYGYENNERFYGKIVYDNQASTADFYINNTLVSKSELGFGVVDFLSVYTTGCYIDFNYTLSGNLPSFSTPAFQFSGNSTGSGYVTNTTPSVLFRLYSGVSESGLYSFATNSGDVTGTSSFNVVRNFELETEEELSDNVKTYDFDLYGNFGVITKSVQVQTTFPIVQQLTTTDISTLSGIETGQGQVLWQNYKGAQSYSPSLPARLRLLYQSGNSGANSFNSIFSASYSGYTNLPPINFPYNPSITGYELNFNTNNSNSILYNFGRQITGNKINVLVDYSGYNTGYNYVLECF